MVFYEKGLGIEQSNELAKYWCLIITRAISSAYVSFDDEYNRLTYYAKVNALYKYAYLHEIGAVENEQNDPFFWYRQVLEINENHAPTLTGFARLYEKQGAFQKAKEFYKKAAELKNAEAQYKLGFFAYRDGDFKVACDYLTKACKQDCMEAYFLVGVMRDHGQGFEQDEKLAREAYQKAASLGHQASLEILKCKHDIDPLLKEVGVNERGIRLLPVDQLKLPSKEQQKLTVDDEPKKNINPAETRRLFEAIQLGNLAQVSALLSSNTDINAKDDSFLTPLILAIKNNQKEIVALLIGQGAYLEAKDNNGGSTALLWAVRKNQKDIVSLLIGNGANINARDNIRETALMKAYTKNI